MGPLAHRKFAEWTQGLDTREAMVSIFYHIRDIPYAIVTGPEFRDPERGPEKMLAEGRGSCGPKHYLLAMMYRRLNVDAVYATFPFFWQEQAVRYPPALREDASLLPLAYHLACRVRIGCRWALVDATWDPPLRKAGFPVNLHWDGIADTACAVSPPGSPERPARSRTRAGRQCPGQGNGEIVPQEGERDHWEAEDRVRYHNERTGARTPADIQRTGRFYEKLNEWLGKVREQEYPGGME